LADYLGKCLVAKRYLPGLGILDDTSINQHILTLLPDHIVTKWNAKVLKAKKASLGFPSFETFVGFLRVEAEKATDSVTSLGAIRKLGKVPSSKVSHAISHSLSGESSENTIVSRSGFSGSRVCLVCKELHMIFECPQFKGLSVADRTAKAKSLSLCFLCLQPGHVSRKCQKKLWCKSCKRNHNTLLHATQEQKSPRVIESSNCGNVWMEGSGPSAGLCSMIVPVWVSTTSKPSAEFLTYAMLDSQSDSTFVTKEVADEVGAQSHQTTLKMSTMTSHNKIIKCEKATNLTIRGYNRSTVVNLPGAFTRSFIPHSPGHIPTSSFARSYQHLEPISDCFPELDSCKVGLLIGYNCSQALLPLQVVRAGESDPFAIETVLGWSIVGGYLSSSGGEVDEVGYSHRVVCHEVPAPLKVGHLVGSD
jgi:hypothetical protein